jgi:hypothetical protein
MTALAAIIVAAIVITATEAAEMNTPLEQVSPAVDEPAPRPPRPHNRGPPHRPRQCRTTRPPVTGNQSHPPTTSPVRPTKFPIRPPNTSPSGPPPPNIRPSDTPMM